MKSTLLIVGFLYLAVALVAAAFQRSLLYFPSHEPIQESALKPWIVEGRVIGYCSEVQEPKSVWLMLHGNAGQAAHRAYALPSLPERSSLYVLEYPGYGARPGSPSRDTINAAAKEAYEALRARHPEVAVIGESIGSGPASFLATHTHPPSRIVLVTPYDTLANAGAAHLPWLPVRLLLRDNWDNVSALQSYKGRVDIYAAINDEVIPVAFAKNLASRIPTAKLHEIPGGHNDWSSGSRVRIY